jgi:hypothetical protein
VERIKESRLVTGRSFSQAAIPIEEGATQLTAQSLQFQEALFDLAEFLLGEISNFTARRPAAISYREDARQLRQRKTQGERSPRYLNTIERYCSVLPVTVRCAFRTRHDPDTLVVA